MGREVVEHDVDLEVSWHVEVDELEEREHVGRLVGLLRVVEDLTGTDVHRREQIRRAVAFVVMSHRADTPGLHRQARLGAVKGLALGLLVEAEDDGALWRVEVEPDDVDELLLEARIPSGSHERRPLPLAILPTASKRRRQERTESFVVWQSRATSFVATPSAASSIARACTTMRCESEVDRAICSSRSR